MTTHTKEQRMKNNIFVLVHLKDEGRPVYVNMHKCTSFEDGCIFLDNDTPILVQETASEIKEQLPKGVRV